MTDRGVSRRNFVSGGVGAGAILFGGQAIANEAKEGLAELIKTVGWDANAPDSFFFLHATDLHASELTSGALKMPDKFGGRNFADDMNALQPKPAFTVMTGDLIAATTRNPATWPQAEAGFRRVKDLIVSRLKIPCHMIIGNNDCSPEAYHKVFPERPVYWSFDRAQVHFTALHGYNLWQPENTNHAGILLDEEQLDWLKRDLAAAAKAKTLVLFTHEPLKDADSHRIRKQIAPLLAAFPGEIWNIAGHNHRNNEQLCRIGGKLVHAVETITPVGSWTPEKGAYRLFFVSNGRISGTGLRWLTKDGEPLHFEAMAADRKIRERPLIETVLADGAQHVFMVGEEDLPLRHGTTGVTDRISNFQFRKGASMIYRVPRAARSSTSARLRLACGPKVSVAFSADGATWQPASEQTRASGCVTFDIPESLRNAAQLDVRIQAAPDQGALLYGFSLLP